MERHDRGEDDRGTRRAARGTPSDPAIPSLTRDREDQILKTAVDRGMVAQHDVTRISGAHPAHPGNDSTGPPGARLMVLVREGHLDPDNAAQLLSQAGIAEARDAMPWLLGAAQPAPAPAPSPAKAPAHASTWAVPAPAKAPPPSEPAYPRRAATAYLGSPLKAVTPPPSPAHRPVPERTLMSPTAVAPLPGRPAAVPSRPAAPPPSSLEPPPGPRKGTPEPTLIDTPIPHYLRQGAHPAAAAPGLKPPFEDQTQAPGHDGADSRETSIPPWLRSFERFRPIKLLGRGGMGDVYKAFDPKLDRHIALKCVRFADDNVAARFVKEAQSQARVKHENVCEIYEIGEHGQHRYIAMQLIEGRTLDDLADELTINEKVAIIRQVALGLHAAHRKGLIHRDIKPANIMAERHESGWRAFVLDFGLVRDLEACTTGFTGHGLALGTPSYMAPEQVTGAEKSFGPWTDTFNLGATLFHLLAGRPPFAGDVPMRTFRMIVEDPAPPVTQFNPFVPRELDAIVAKALAKDPADRYTSAIELANDLGRYLDGDPLDIASRGFLYRTFKKARKNVPMVIALAVASAAALVLGAGAFMMHRQSVLHSRLALAVGEGLGDVENLVAGSHARAAHDVTADHAAAFERLDQILAIVDDGGGRAGALRHAARGRALLAMRQPRAAARELEQAVASDVRDPALSIALAEALGDVQELDAGIALSTDDPMVGRGRLQALDAGEARVQSLFESAAAAATVPDPSMDARLAISRRQWPVALEAIGRMGSSPSDRAEAEILRARVQSGRARAAILTGDAPAALASLEEAAQSLAVAGLLMPSDPGVADAACANFVALADIKRLEGATPALDPAMAACEGALRIDPARPSALVSKAHLLRLRARSAPSRETLEQSMDAANAAIANDVATPGAHLTLALAAAASARIHGAPAAHARSMETLAASSLRRAEDIPATRDAALQAEATEFARLAEQDLHAGLEPGARLAHAERTSEAFTDAQPRNPRAWTARARVVALSGLRRDATEDSARREVQMALEHVTPLDPQQQLAGEIAGVAATSAAVRVARGWDPTTEVALARRIATTAQKEPGTDVSTFLAAARADLAAADWQLSQGLSAGDALVHAGDVLALAARRGASPDDIAPMATGIDRRIVEMTAWDPLQSAAASAAMRRGLRSVAAWRAAEPASPLPLIEEARLRLLAAQPRGRDHVEQLQQAQALLASARELGAGGVLLASLEQQARALAEARKATAP